MTSHVHCLPDTSLTGPDRQWHPPQLFTTRHTVLGWALGQFGNNANLVLCVGSELTTTDYKRVCDIRHGKQ